MVGGTVMGSVAATDRRTIGAQADDAAIVLKGEGRARKITGELGRVAVTSFNHRVLLTGEVTDDKMKAEVEQQIVTIDGVKSVENDLVVAPVSSMGARSNDALITGKVKAAIIDTKDLYVNAFKVQTDRGVVYLMGRVTQREGKLAAEVARNAASKIKKVVKLFEYISEEDLKELSTKPASEQQKDSTR
jgi:osmotically-inducible protein OsmY